MDVRSTLPRVCSYKIEACCNIVRRLLLATPMAQHCAGSPRFPERPAAKRQELQCLALRHRHGLQNDKVVPDAYPEHWNISLRKRRGIPRAPVSWALSW